MDGFLSYFPQSTLGWSPLQTLGAALLTLAIAGFVRGFAGFGSGMVAMPFLSALYGPLVAVPTMLSLEVIISIPLLPKALSAARWRSVLVLSTSACLVTPLGAWLLETIGGPKMRVFISVAILASVVALGAGIKRKGPITNFGSGIAGALSGLLASLSAVSGPPVVLYYLSGPEPVAATRGALILAFLIIDAAALMAIVLGGGGGGTGPLVPALMVVFVLGGLVGQRLFAGASEGGYRGIALGMITASALGALAL